MKIACVVGSAAVLVGCGSPKLAAKAGPVDTAKSKADTTQPAAPAERDDRLRDSAVGPMYMVDSTGKVTKIKKPDDSR